MVLKTEDKVLKNEMRQEQEVNINKNENADNLTAAINQNGDADIDNTIQATDTDKIIFYVCKNILDVMEVYVTIFLSSESNW